MKLKKALVTAIIAMMAALVLAVPALAAPVEKWSDNVELWDGDYDVDLESLGKYDGESVFRITAKATCLCSNAAHEGVGFYLSNGEYIGNESYELRGEYAVVGCGKTYSIVVGPESLVKDEHLYVYAHSNVDMKLAYTIERYSGYADAVSVPSSMTVSTGSKKTVSASFTPSDTISPITWKSSNTAIATVTSQGCVAGKKAGKCTITAKIKNGDTASCTVTITNPKPYLNKKSANLYRGQKFSLKLVYPTGKVTYKSSNKKIATVSKSGKVTGKSLGKCRIYVKSKGKTYTCKVNVKRLNPNFGAYLYDYDTRNNKFVVKIKNWGKKTLTIPAGYGKVEDCDYKSYDRTVYLGSTVKIKPGKSKTIKFKVRGRTTWYDHTDFTLFHKFIYDGKTYTWHVWCEDSVLKKGKKWYSTYWISYEDNYWNWIC